MFIVVGEFLLIEDFIGLTEISASLFYNILEISFFYKLLTFF